MPYILLLNKTGRFLYLIGVTTCENSNIERKYMEKVRYEPLAGNATEIWRLDRVVVVSIILTATSIVL